MHNRRSIYISLCFLFGLCCVSLCGLKAYATTDKDLAYRISLAEGLCKLGLYQKAVYEVSDLLNYVGENKKLAQIVNYLDKKGALCFRQQKEVEMARALDKVSDKVHKVRPGNSRFRIHGKIRVSGGVNSKGDLLWKDVNPDKSSVPYEKSWRYLWGEERENTFDPEIYSRLELDMSGDISSNLGFFTQLVLDPWSYVGDVDVHVVSTTGNDWADIRLKYIFATGRTLNETFRTQLGNILNFDEIKVVNGRLSAYTPTGLYDWWTYFNPIGGEKVHGRWNILRKLWLNYKGNEWLMKVFALSDQSEALTSDDPLRLSNNHKDWEESPWIDTYEPSRIFTRTGNPVKAGRWVRNISAYVKDSDWNRLTYLRGMSLSLDLGSVVADTVIASPLTLWDDYNDINSAEAATRWKFFMDRDKGDYVGLISTAKLGFADDKSLEARNYVLACDSSTHVIRDLIAQGEVAYSTTRVKEANGYKDKLTGYAYEVKLLTDHNDLVDSFQLYGSYADRGFFPGLSNYRYTRREEERSKHIYFDQAGEKDSILDYGDGIDRSRIVVGGLIKLSVLGFKASIFGRNVHATSGSYLESLVRSELEGNICSPKLKVKLLAWYKFLPKTKAGKDPLISADNIYALSDYYSNDSEMMNNSAIEAGKDPSIGHFSGGLKYDILSNLSVEGVLEYTNDIGDFPRLLFSDSYVTNTWQDGVLWDKLVPFLYNQSIFGLPPYPYYHIVRLKLNYTPWDWLTLKVSYTRNENKFATGIDDNVNHLGFELNYKPLSHLTMMFSYVYSRMYDLYVYSQEHRLDYASHNNFFVGMRWQMSNLENLEIMWGEYGPFLENRDYWYLSTVDTQHLFRIVYKRKF